MGDCPSPAADAEAAPAAIQSRLPPESFAAALRAVIFDMDGLMLDTERWERAAWRESAARHGHALSDEFFASLVGRRESDTLPRMRAYFGPQFPFESARQEARARFDHWIAHCPRPAKPGLMPLLELLEQRGIALAVASSTRRARAQLRLRELLMRFRVSVFGDEVEHAKPHPQIYQRALAALGTGPGETLALEDSPPGWSAAAAAGLTAIVIPDLLPPPPQAPYVCRSLGDVEAWVRGSATRPGVA